MAIITEPGYRKVCARQVPKGAQLNIKQPKNTYLQNFSSAVRKTWMIFCQE
jgi:hypothetical protein